MYYKYQKFILLATLLILAALTIFLSLFIGFMVFLIPSNDASTYVTIEVPNSTPTICTVLMITPSPTPTSIPTPTPTPTPTPSPVPGYINANGVNFRKSPSLNGEILLSLPALEKVGVIYNIDGWFKILYNGLEGFIAEEFLSLGLPPTPTPTPRYGRWTEDDYLLLATTIYCEASARGGLEEAAAVGWVIRNRLEDKDTWGDDTWHDVISRSNQFSVYSTKKKSKFQRILKSIAGATDSHSKNAKRMARYVMQGRDKYRIPEDVQFFCSYSYYQKVKKSNGNWGSHKLYAVIGDTAFFYK